MSRIVGRTDDTEVQQGVRKVYRMKSIMQKKDGTCYLCRRLHGDTAPKATQCRHVVFGTANRKLSEKHGLKVYLGIKEIKKC